MYAKHQLNSKEKEASAPGALMTVEVGLEQRPSNKETRHHQGEEKEAPPVAQTQSKSEADSHSSPSSTNTAVHLPPLPARRPLPPIFPLSQTSTGSQPGAFRIRPSGRQRSDAESSYGVPEREEPSANFALPMGGDESTTVSPTVTTTGTRTTTCIADAPSLDVMISAILVEEGNEEHGCFGPAQQETSSSSMTLVKAEPALEGYKAIVANKKFKFLVLATIIIYIALTVPLVVEWCQEDVHEMPELSSHCGTPPFQFADYRGQLNVTESGRTCQRWDAQDPHPHKHTPEAYPSVGLQENYCRNPTGGPDERAWCYTADPNVLWEYCNVPTCN